MTTTNEYTTSTQTLLLAAALSHEKRWAILLYLEKCAMAMNVTLVKHLGLSQSDTSRQLTILLDAGLLEKSMYARNTVYSLRHQIWLKAKALHA